jgi:membrane protein
MARPQKRSRRGIGWEVASALLVAGAALIEEGRRKGSRRRPAARSRREPSAGRGQWPHKPVRTNADDRGRQARSPAEIPRAGWKDILVRTWKEFGEDQVPMVAAGVTFYSILALFPGLAALIALYGLIADPADIPRHLQALSTILPGGALTVLGEQMGRLVAAKSGGMSLTAAVGLLASLWSANGAVKSLMVGLNIAYEEHETRGFVKKTLVSLAFTLGMAAFGVAAVGVLGAGPVIERHAGRPAVWLFDAISWPALLVVMSVGLALFYRHGPSRDPVRFRWISWGSAGAVIVWLLMSVAYSLYVANFGHFNRTYGSLGAAVGFMMWIWLSAMVVLAGAELNAEVEHQTTVDTTRGPANPMGVRGAKMADTVGAAQGR